MVYIYHIQLQEDSHLEISHLLYFIYNKDDLPEGFSEKFAMDVGAKEKVRAKFQEEDRKISPAAPPPKQLTSQEQKKGEVIWLLY